MNNLFTTRECAIGIYFGILLIYVLSNKTCRKSLLNVFRTAKNKYIIIPTIVMSFYLLVILYFAKEYLFITPIIIKEIIMWFIFVGIPNCFNAVDTKEKHYFRSIIFKNFKLSSFMAFVCSSYTFGLLGEMILQLIIFILALFSAIAGIKKETKMFENLANIILGILYIWLFAKSLYIIISNIATIGYKYYLTEISIPIVLSLLFIPLAYLFALYAKYQIFSFRLGNIVSEYEKKRKKYLLKIFWICGLSYNRIKTFNVEFIPYLCFLENVDDIDNIIMNLNKKNASQFFKNNQKDVSKLVAKS